MRHAPDAVRGTKAETYIGKSAIDVGLADHVGTFGQALDALVRSMEVKNNPAGVAKTTATAKTTRNGSCHAIAQKIPKKSLKASCPKSRQKMKPPMQTLKTKTAKSKPKTSSRMQVLTRTEWRGAKYRDILKAIPGAYSGKGNRYFASGVNTPFVVVPISAILQEREPGEDG